jgi:hypothetical protein
MRRLLAIGAGVALSCGLATAAFAWNDIGLSAACAPDADSLAWTIDLPSEKNFKVDWSWGADFATFATVDFGSAGEHDFTTPRGGDTLYVRWTSDIETTAQAAANTDLCAHGAVATPTPEGSVEGATGTPASSPEGGVEAGTSSVAPGTGIPDTAVTRAGAEQIPAMILAALLVASVGLLMATNIVARRERT